MDQPDTSPGRAPDWLILLTLWLVMFAVSSQFLIIAPLLPRIEAVLHVDEELLGSLVTAYAATVGVFAIVAGPVSDKVGRRTILRLGTAGFAGALLLHGLADSYLKLLAVRALAGACSGLMSGAAAAYVGDVFPYSRRGWAMGWVMSGMAFGQIVGVPMGSALASRLDFRAPFLILGAVMVVAFFLASRVLHDPGGREGRQLTLASAVDSYRTLLGRGEVLALVTSGAMMMLGVSMFIVYQPKWLEASLHATPDQVALMFLAGGLANATMAPVAGRLSDRLGRKGVIVAGSAGVAVLMALTPMLPSIGWAYPLFFLVMSAAAMRISPLNALLTAIVEDRYRGTMLSLSMSTSQVGFALGSAAAGPIYAKYSFAGDARIAAVATLLAAIILAVAVPEPGLEEPADPAAA
ncbi:MAG: MFS transporter [Deltaproteobacteria bacterium]|nr:MAG: MFS transporter [Deltaproteobacteria bacterium]